MEIKSSPWGRRQVTYRTTEVVLGIDVTAVWSAVRMESGNIQRKGLLK